MKINYVYSLCNSVFSLFYKSLMTLKLLVFLNLTLLLQLVKMLRDKTNYNKYLLN